MKNIHILPTDKPSKLQLQMNGNFHIENGQTIVLKNYKNIYITSDEEIKEKEYVLIIREGLLIGKLDEVVLIDSTKEYRTEYTRMDGTKGWFASDVNYQKDWNYKKIILTTDQDLIKDGVQAINDEFLEWYVKNPSCEVVEVMKVCSTGRKCDGKSKKCNTAKLKIIIPKEETLEEAAEVAERIAMTKDWDFESSEGNGYYDYVEGFTEGAKWQAERMYSEEEVRELLSIQRGNCYVAILSKTNDTELASLTISAPEPKGKDGWVKQFKKK